ncbi:hypothetical protein ANCCAN_04312 [Ancylostoma caninum]|uniref:BTB domain-containing protein n=1 Tax=Ancylostoma caninum TaxID=29170 RepID=A0A368H2P0_ANCCA|nr:hypothetical protein ANCCAN_04312 [Ancylostoma caninum]
MSSTHEVATLFLSSRRPEKRGNVQSIPIVSLPCSSLSTFEVKDEPCSESTASSSDTCSICSKNLSHLNDLRKVAHVNKCLDAQESKSNHAKATEKWNNTIDCPMCGEPQPPGPHRSAHAKRCGKAYHIPPKELLRLMETQSRVSDAKKRASMIHTKAPVPVKKEVAPPKLQGAPKSVFDENIQLAQAISASMAPEPIEMKQDSSPQFTRIADPNEKRRKRPRSYAIVELAPRSCKCEVLEKVHDRFLQSFKVRKPSGETSSHSEVCQRRSERTTMFMQYQTRLLEKLERLERLSEDLSNLTATEMTSDIQIQCSDGTLNAHRSLLRTRTSLLGKATSQSSTSSIDISECQRVVSSWLRYVYSGRIDWQSEDTEKIQKLAEQYGPDDLAPLCIRMMAASHSDGVVSASASGSDPTSSCASVAASEEKVEESSDEPVTTPAESLAPSPVPEVVVPEILKVELNEPGTGAEMVSDQTLDSEDPLQGIQLASSVNSSASDCIVIDDDDDVKSSKEAEVNQATGCSEETIGDGTSPSASREKITSFAQDAEADMLITLVDMPELDTPQASVVSKSPDLFDEKSRDKKVDDVEVVDDFSWDLTPLRASAGVNRRSSRLSLKADGLGNSFAGAGKAAEPSDDLEIVEAIETPAGVTAANCNDVVCLDEHSRPVSIENQVQPEQPHDPYEDEYYNYHDPFVEAWYEPVEMSQLSASQPIEVEAEAAKRCSGSPTDNEKVTVRRRSKVRKSVRSSSDHMLETVVASGHPVHENEALVHSYTQDSFFDTPRFFNPPESLRTNGMECGNSFTVNRASPNFVPPVAQSTPAQPARKKPRFGSNVKILKTSGITPMPNYEGMTDEELKRELVKFGVRPMGRKRAIALLKRIYDEVHPVIDPFTPTVRPLAAEKAGGDTPLASRQAKAKKPRARGKAVAVEPAVNCAPVAAVKEQENVREAVEAEDEDFVDLGDKTLNEPRDEPPEESMIDDTGILPKDLEGMTRTFLAWLRRPENDQLYNHLLSLQPVLIDELHLRMSRADSAVCGIPKKALANVLDRLGVTFSLPLVYGHRKGNGGRRGGK